MGWTNFFVIASSLSLANALIVSGAAAWLADTLVGGVEGLRDHPMLILLVMSFAAAAARMLMPNISGYLDFIIPVAMSTRAALGLNPVVCGLAVVSWETRLPTTQQGPLPVFSSSSERSSKPRRCSVWV